MNFFTRRKKKRNPQRNESKNIYYSKNYCFGMLMKMDISKMDKAEVLATLFNNSRPLGMGMLHYKNRDMSVEEAREILKTQTDFDYLEGRVMKINLSGDELRTWLYNRDNGENAAEKALAVLSK